MRAKCYLVACERVPLPGTQGDGGSASPCPAASKHVSRVPQGVPARGRHARVSGNGCFACITRGSSCCGRQADASH